MIGLVTQVFQHRQFFCVHLRGDLLKDTVAGTLVRQRGNYNTTLFLLPHGAQLDRAVAGLVHLHDLGTRGDDLGRDRVVRALDVFAQFLNSAVWFLQQADTGSGDLAQIVRGDVGRHTDSDTGGAIQQYVRQPGR